MSNLRLPFVRIDGDLFGTLDATFHARMGGSSDTRKLGYQTWVVSEPNTVSLRHNGTDIVSVTREDATTDKVTLNASGYRSPTTANRMRMLFDAAGIPASVSIRDGDYMLYLDGRSYPYRDGMSFSVVYSRDGHASPVAVRYPNVRYPNVRFF